MRDSPDVYYFIFLENERKNDMIAVLLADGFEEIEALTPVDMLRRAGAEVVTVGISSSIATGSHGIKVVCDRTAEQTDPETIDAVIFPGGMPGALNLDASPYTDKVIDAVMRKGGRIAAICASPLILGRRGLLVGKKATCYPGFEPELKGATPTGGAVETDGNITTGRSMGTALEFAKELTALLCGGEKSLNITKSIVE